MGLAENMAAALVRKGLHLSGSCHILVRIGQNYLRASKCLKTFEIVAGYVGYTVCSASKNLEMLYF